ncbi:hypothetical protein H8467_005225 [Salmonella enterica]|nr:hypothetical protein [Salmonella enterica]
MKHAEKAGNNNAGRVNVARRYHPSRLSAISGLALLLSGGFSGSASAVTFTFDYTYTIVGNTCTLTSTGAKVNNGLDVTGSNNTVQGNFDVDWGTVTKEELKAPDKASKKTFGLAMDCQGDIYQPTLTVTGNNGSNPNPSSDILYVADDANSVAGFAVKASNDATEQDVIKNALNNQGTRLTLSGTGHQKKIWLTAWPVIMPNKKDSDLKSGTDITGTVTIKVSYN